jgi:microcystin-dependent protein
VSEPFLGEVRMFGFNFPPRGWALCNGQIISLAQNTALFSLLGTTYGGNGQTTFALPNLQSRLAVGLGTGPGLSSYVSGQTGGVESMQLAPNQLPSHPHSQPVTNGPTGGSRPNGAVPSAGGSYAPASDGGAFSPTSSIGGNVPFDIRQPFLAMNYSIALEGIFPSRN